MSLTRLRIEALSLRLSGVAPDVAARAAEGLGAALGRRLSGVDFKEAEMGRIDLGTVDAAGLRDAGDPEALADALADRIAGALARGAGGGR